MNTFFKTIERTKRLLTLPLRLLVLPVLLLLIFMFTDFEDSWDREYAKRWISRFLKPF